MADMNKETLTMPFDETKEIVVERYSYDEEHTEITVYLRCKSTGVIIQDIALVRKSETENSVECLVWGDENSEDYTDRFSIPPYDYEEEQNETH